MKTYTEKMNELITSIRPGAGNVMEQEKLSRDDAKMQRLAMEIGKKLRRLRVDSRLTQEVLAKKVALSQPEISLIETGKRLPSLPDLVHIADELDESITSIIRKVDIKAN